MEASSKIAVVTRNVVQAADDLVPYGKAERLTAGICMGIPFFLMVAGLKYEDRGWWWFTALAIFFILLPFVIGYVARIVIKQRHNDGLYVTMISTGVLLLFYLFFRQPFEGKMQNSISMYVTIQDSFIFGLLLTIGAMLFITNGLVYWNEFKVSNDKDKGWRAYGNVLLGLSLEGVVLFPCTHAKPFHYFFAGTFFVGCALATILRTKKRTQHKFVDYTTAIIMVLGFIVLAGKAWLHWSGVLVDWITLFGAESVGLWVIGVDFLLVSLRRELDTAAGEIPS